jgi:hypothetical protein
VPRHLTLRWSPNPFNPSIVLALQVPGSGPHRVGVTLFDIRGRRVRMLHEGLLPPGSHTMVWDGRDADGRALASGVYLYRVQVADEVRSGKITLLR